MGQLSPTRPPDGANIGLDTVVFIYFLEHHEVHYPAARLLLERIEAGRLTAVVSALVFSELAVPAFRAGDAPRAQAVTDLLTAFPGLSIIPVTPEISVHAARLRADHGLRTPDAIHIATALLAEADALVTNDHRLQRNSPPLDLLLF